MSSNLSTISSSNLRRALTKQKQENGKIREQQEKSMINKIPEELVSAKKQHKMPSSVSLPFRSSDLCWEQCARLLMTLPIEDICQLRITLNLVMQNIQNHPNDEKYRRLKASNPNLQRKIFSQPGGTEILLSLGFIWEIQESTKEKVLIYPLLPGREQAESDAMRRIVACQEWLTNTVETCEQIVRIKAPYFVDSSKIYVAGEEDEGDGYELRKKDKEYLTLTGHAHRVTKGELSIEHNAEIERQQRREIAILRNDGHHVKADARERQLSQLQHINNGLQEEKSTGDFVALSSTCPADTLIQLQLPTGKRVTGGFLLGDELLQVYRFACSYFEDIRHIGIELRLPHEKAPFEVEDFTKNIEQLQLFPRAKILVVNAVNSAMKQMDATVRMEEAKKRADEEVERRRKREAEQRTKREVERQKIEDERQRTLKRFQDDRERQKNPTPIVESTPPVAKKNDLGNTLVKSKSVTLTKTVNHRK